MTWIMKVRFCISLGACFCLLTSCSSLRGFKNPVTEGNLYGMIIDEKNQPVRDFKITCEDERKSVKNAVTNASGIFVMENLLTGEVLVSGSKSGFVEIKNESIEFLGVEKVFCWQINSTEGVLSSVERLIKEGEYQRALRVIRELKVEEQSREGKYLKELESALKRKMRSKREVVNDKEVEA